MSTLTTPHALTWFEIPVQDLDRAQRFYETLLGRPLRRETMGPHALAVFPYGEGQVGGCLMAGPAMSPSTDGSLIYLAAGPRLAEPLGRLAAAGGRLLQPRTELPGELGCFALLQDSEGNRVGLHAPQ
jgi:uncharacterized protein